MSPGVETYETPSWLPSHPDHAGEIPWREWDASAFDRARLEDRPILLAMVTAWSVDARVMDATTYSDQRVIDLLRGHFVCVRLDAEERPDVEARYGAGEPPGTVFLTPDGDPVSSSGFMGVDEFLATATRVLDQWHDHREDVLQGVEAARATRAAERATARATRGPGILTPEILDVALEVVEARWDDDPPTLAEDSGSQHSFPEYQYPHPEVLRLWRYAYHRRGLAPQFNHAFDLARSMAEGPIFDREQGGFFRRARGPQWDDPPGEKRAADQGAMLLAFAELASSDEEARDELAASIEQTASYLIDILGDYSGAVASSQVTEDALATGVMDAGVDRRVFAASAASVARALLVAGSLLDRRDWVERGRRMVDFLLSHLRAGEAGMYHAWEPSGPRTLGLLSDQTGMVLALLTAYEVSGQTSYFEHARRIARVLERDWHEPGLGFRDLTFDHEETGLLAEPRYPLDMNVATAEAFTWLARLTHDERFLATAQDTLSAFAHGLEGRGLTVADFARVVDRLLTAEPEFKVVSEYPPGEPDVVADPLHLAALRLPLAARTIQRLDGTADVDLMRQLGLPDVAKVGYVCSGGTCSPALTDPEQWMPAVDELLEGPAW